MSCHPAWARDEGGVNVFIYVGGRPEHDMVYFVSKCGDREYIHIKRGEETVKWFLLFSRRQGDTDKS